MQSNSPLLKAPRNSLRKDSNVTHRTQNNPEIDRKFSKLQFGPASQHRSRSFTKVKPIVEEKKKHKHKKCKKKQKKEGHHHNHHHHQKKVHNN